LLMPSPDVCITARLGRLGVYQVAYLGECVRGW